MNNEQQVREAYEAAKARYHEQWSDADCPISQPEDDAYKAGFHDGYAAALASAPEAGKCGDDTEEVIEKLGYAVRVLSEGVTVSNCTERMIAAVNMASRALEDYNKYKGLPSRPTPTRDGE